MNCVSEIKIHSVHSDPILFHTRGNVTVEWREIT